MSKVDVQFNEDALADLVKTDRAQAVFRALIDNANRIYEDALRGREGKTVEDIKREISGRIDSENDGQITEPELTTIATLLHSGKKVWVEYDGRIMAEE